MEFSIVKTESLNPKNQNFESFNTLRVYLSTGEIVLVYQNLQSKTFQTIDPRVYSARSFSSMFTAVEVWFEEKAIAKEILRVNPVRGGESQHKTI